MGIFDQRVTNRTQPTAQNRFGNTGTVSGSASGSASRIHSYSQGMNFSRGQIIRGEVIDLRNHEVKVQLAGGRILSGSIDEAVELSIGESATFQVTEATPSSVSLKVLSDQRALSQELTIDKALEAAGLPKSERNISAVRELLAQGLSVDKNSIQELLKQSAMFRGVSFHTLALMSKLQIPVTEVNANQMEAYLNYEHRIMHLAEQTAAELTGAISSAMESGNSDAAAALNQEVLSLLVTSEPSSSATLLTGLSADAPLASFALLDSDGTLALLDTLEPFGLTGEETAAIVNGSATLRQTAALILHTADRLNTAASNASNGMQTEAVPDTAPGGTAQPAINAAPASGASLFRSLLQSAGSIFGNTQTGNPADGTASAGSSAGVMPGSAAVPGTLPGAPASGILPGSGTPAALAAFLSADNAQAAEQLFAGLSAEDIARALSGRLPLLPGQMTPAEAMNNLPALLQTPEVYAILGEYASLARNSLELSGFLPKDLRLELSSQLKGKLPATVLKKLEDGELTAADLLKLLLEQSQNQPDQDSSYLSSQAYQEILRQMLLNRFSMRPQDLNEKDAAAKYYDALDHDLAVLEKIQNRTSAQPAFQDTAANMRDNIDFMKTLNQLFPYLQLPMKLSNQNAHAELYVYTKKEELLRDPSAVSVLLHLDMEQLGPLDIHLNLEKKNLQARFYLPDAVAAAVTRENFSLLRQSLSAKGYTLDARAEERKSSPNLIRDLLSPEKEGSSMKRYSFDIRA